MREVSREWLEFLREQYPKGSRVRLTKMGNDPHPIPPGSMGTLKYIDDVGQFHVKWDNGRGLALIIGEDQFQILPPEPQTIKFYMPLTAQLYAYDDWGDLEEYGNDLDGRESITLKRLRDLTESVDCCHVVESVVSDGQLGRFYAENGFVPEVEGMSDAAFELLDFEKVGKMARMGECGVYVPSGISGLGGYVVQHSDLKSAPEITLNQPVEPAYTIHLRLTAHHDNLPFAGTDVVDLKLPAEDNALEMAVRCLGYVDWGAVECTCLDCKVPQLAEHITNAVPFETIERLGDVLAQMSAAALPAYKALMTATHCQNIVDALDLAEQVDEYILSPSIASPEDAAAEELAFILPEKAAKMIRPHINLHTYGQALLASRNNIQTEYGLLERRDGQSIQTIGQQKQEPQLGGMELG